MKKILMHILAFTAAGLFFFGIYYMVDREESMKPKYIIKTDKDYYRTDTFNIDSNNCIHFIQHEIKISGVRYGNVSICGGRYTIEEKCTRK